MSVTLALSTPGADTIQIVRRFAAPKAQVFKAWTDPALVPQWMSIPEWPMTTCTADLKVGGHFRYEWGTSEHTMGVSGVFVEYSPPDRIVHTEVFDEDWTGGPTTVTTRFDEHHGHTTVTLTIRYQSAQARDAVAQSPMQYGMDRNYLNLDDLLGWPGVPFDPTLDLRLVREVPVPPAKVWMAWTTPALLAQWFAPQPWSVAKAEVDPRPGGAFNVVMQSPEGVAMDEDPGCVLAAWPNRRIVWTDALGPGFRPKGGGFMTATLDVVPTPDGCRYTATVRHANPEACEQHRQMGFEQGWGTMVEQLATLMSG